MNKVIIAFSIGLLYFHEMKAQVEYKVITSVESIVPGGRGRSRIISSDVQRNFQDFTSTRSADNNTRNKSDRGDIRVKEFSETKLLNFYNAGGIRFQNIVSNDILMSSKINSRAEEGWELAFVTNAVESDSGETDRFGILITRYIFKRNKQN